MSITSDIIDVIRRHSRFLVTSHIRADGDSIGSEVATLHALRALGKDVQVVNDGPVPRIFQFLDTQGELSSDAASAWGDPGVVIVLDATALDRTGQVAKRIRDDALIVNIDHHVSNERFGTLNWIGTEHSSTGEMLYGLFEEGGMLKPGIVLDALYVAIITDTGRFTQGNATAGALEAAGGLVRAGVDAGEIGNQLYRNESFGLALLRAKAFTTIEQRAEGRAAVMCLTQKMFADTGVDPIDTQEFADIPRSLAGVEVGVLLRELPEAGRIKVSFRSRGKVDVNAIAQRFDGGGHVRASGCEVPGSLDQVKEMIFEQVLGALRSS